MEFPTRWWFSPDNETPPHTCPCRHGQRTEKTDSEVPQSCSTLCDPMNYSLPASFIHGIFQTRILEWVVIPFFRRSSWPRDWTWVSRIVGRSFTVWPTGKRRPCGQRNKCQGKKELFMIWVKILNKEDGARGSW